MARPRLHEEGKEPASISFRVSQEFLGQIAVLSVVKLMEEGRPVGIADVFRRFTEEKLFEVIEERPNIAELIEDFAQPQAGMSFEPSDELIAAIRERIILARDPTVQ
jgi:hypothetical protein